MAAILSIQVGLPRTLGTEHADDPHDRPWTTAIFKSPVAGPVWLGRTNLVGDGQGDLIHHGGPDKAVNAYPSEHYPFWQAELALPGLPGGSFGENFTTLGLLEEVVCIGDIYDIGQAQVQISQPRQPCWKLARRWRIKDLALRVQESGRTGWYFRVLREGEVESGDEINLIERPHPKWTVATANLIMHRRQHDFAAAQSLAACPALSKSWQETLAKRVAQGAPASTSARLDGGAN